MLRNQLTAHNMQDHHDIHIKPHVDLSVPIQLNDTTRFVLRPSANPLHMTAVMGSTYTSSQKKHHDELHLDAIYCDYLHDNQRVTDVVVAVGDGCGGHITPEEDIMIALATHHATQHAASTLAQFNITSQTLIETAQAISKDATQHILSETQRRNPNIVPGSTTLAAAKVTLADQRFIFTGFNIGDCLIAAYNPHTRELFSLLNARQSHGMGGLGTASIASRTNRYEIVTYSQEIPEDCILLVMTDGCYEYLATFIEAEQKNVKDRMNITCDYRYREYRLDETKILPLFATLALNAPVDHYRDALMQAVVAEVEQRRIAANSSNKNATSANQEAKNTVEFCRIGDDIALSVIRISRAAFIEGFNCCIAPVLEKNSAQARALSEDDAANKARRRSGIFADHDDSKEKPLMKAEKTTKESSKAGCRLM